MVVVSAKGDIGAAILIPRNWEEPANPSLVTLLGLAVETLGAENAKKLEGEYEHPIAAAQATTPPLISLHLSDSPLLPLSISLVIWDDR